MGWHHQPVPTHKHHTCTRAARACYDIILRPITHAHPNTKRHRSVHVHSLDSLPRLPPQGPLQSPRGHSDWRRTSGCNHQSAEPHTHAITPINTFCTMSYDSRRCISTAAPHPTNTHIHTNFHAHAAISTPNSHARPSTHKQPVVAYICFVHSRACPN